MPRGPRAVAASRRGSPGRARTVRRPPTPGPRVPACSSAPPRRPSGLPAAAAPDRTVRRASGRCSPWSPRSPRRAKSRTPPRARADPRDRRPRDRSPARSRGLSPRRPAPSPSGSPPSPRLHDEVAARERAASLFEVLDITEPPAVVSPTILQADHGGQRFIDRYDRIHLEMLGDEASLAQRLGDLVLVPGEARAATGLAPLIGVEADEGQDATVG